MVEYVSREDHLPKGWLDVYMPPEDTWSPIMGERYWWSVRAGLLRPCAMRGYCPTHCSLDSERHFYGTSQGLGAITPLDLYSTMWARPKATETYGKHAKLNVGHDMEGVQSHRSG